LDWFFNLDRDLFLQINHFRNDFFDYFFVGISLLGEYGIIWIILGLIAFIFDKKNGKYFLLAIILGLLLSLFINNIFIKPFFFRQRPFVELADVYRQGLLWTNSSFPSGHAMSSFASIIIIFNFYKKYFKWALIFAILLLYSRVYLGMHYPTDVFAGAILGAICGLIVITFYDKIKKA